MTLLTLALTIIIVGVLLWAVTTFIPMQENIRKLLYVVVAVFLILWILQGFGLINTGLRLR